MKTYFKMVDMKTGEVNRICIYRKPNGDWCATECYHDWSTVGDYISYGLFTETHAIEAVYEKFPNCVRIPREYQSLEKVKKAALLLFVVFLFAIIVLYI